MSNRSETAGFMAMKGAGYYSKATTGARDVIDAAAPLIMAAVDRIPRNDVGRAFRCADLGCADGGTSVDMWRRVLAHQRAREPARRDRDRLRRSAAQRFQPALPHDPRPDRHQELLRRDPGRLSRSPRAPRSIRRSSRAKASTWHSRPRPRTTSRRCRATSPTTCTWWAPAARSGVPTRRPVASSGSGSSQSAHARAGQGRRLVFLNFGIDEKGRYLGHTGGVSMFDTFNALWRELASEGVITGAEYANTNFPQVYRTAEQFTAPLRDHDQPGLSRRTEARARGIAPPRVPLRQGLRAAQGCRALRPRVHPDAAVLERADVCERTFRRARAASSARASWTSSSAATSAWWRRARPVTAWTTSTSTWCAPKSEPPMSDATRGPRGPGHAELRPPDVVMRLARMGAAHQTRLSFLRSHAPARGARRLALHASAVRHRCAGCRRRHLLRRRSGRGPTASSPSATTCRRSGAPTASSPRPGMRRSCSTTACPSDAEVERLRQNVPRQEAGRYLPSELILARANRSVRLFERVVARLERGPAARGARASRPPAT